MVFLTQALALAVIVLERSGDSSSAAEIAGELTHPMMTIVDRPRDDRSVAALQSQLATPPTTSRRAPPR